MAYHPLPAERIRWQADKYVPSDIESADHTGQDRRFELQARALEQLVQTLAEPASSNPRHVYLCGRAGSGRSALLDAAFKQVRPEAGRLVDFCFVHNFTQPDRPRLIQLPGGEGRRFHHRLHEVGQFIHDQLPKALGSAPVRNRIGALHERTEREIRKLTADLERRLRDEGLMLVRHEVGRTARLSIHIRRMDHAISPEEFANLVEKGQASISEAEAFREQREAHKDEINRLGLEVSERWSRMRNRVDLVLRDEAGKLMRDLTAPVLEDFPHAGVPRFVEEMVEDVLEKRVGREIAHLAEPTLLYGVNVINSRAEPDRIPIIREFQPNPSNLVGTVDPAWLGSHRAVSSFRGIRGGSLIQADGGFLILDARDVHGEPGSWRQLMRALREGLVEIPPPDLGWPYSARSLKPEPVPVRVRVVLIGDPAHYRELNRSDPEFRHQFRTRINLERIMPRDPDSVARFSRALAARLAHYGIMPLSHGGMAAAVEYATRLTDRGGCLGTDLEAMVDLARSAARGAAGDGAERIGRGHVQAAAEGRQISVAMESRFSDPSEQAGLRGRAVGRVHAVTAGPDRHDSARIRCAEGIATPAADWSLYIDLPDDASAQAGRLAAQTTGLLSQLLQLDCPLGMRAMVALRGLHAGDGLHDTEGEGLSLASVCCLLSRISEVPVRQDLVLAGQVDLFGRLLPVRRINDQIEAVFDLASAQGLSGNQGVVVPRANLRDLMVSPRVVKACANDSFRLYTADTVHQVMEMLSGIRAGALSGEGYPPDTLLYRAREKARSWWRQASGLD